MTEDRCKRAMIVRMNYILDTGYGLVNRAHYVRQSLRTLPRYLGRHLLYDSEQGYISICGERPDLNYLVRQDQGDLERTLACTAKAFVNLCLPYLEG